MAPPALTDAHVAMLRINDMGYLAPIFRVQVDSVVAQMTILGHDPIVFETLRLPRLQAEYYRRGASRQSDVLKSTHGFGLATDIISKKHGWGFSPKWRSDLVTTCASVGVTCGGLWTSFEDWPHIQWGGIPGVVPAELIAAFKTGGLHAAWAYAGAL